MSWRVVLMSLAWRDSSSNSNELARIKVVTGEASSNCGSVRALTAAHGLEKAMTRETALFDRGLKQHFLCDIPHHEAVIHHQTLR